MENQINQGSLVLGLGALIAAYTASTYFLKKEHFDEDEEDKAPKTTAFEAPPVAATTPVKTATPILANNVQHNPRKRGLIPRQSSVL